MKKYTQEEFDNFEIVNGIRQCPTGDYTAITRFGEHCSFGEYCRFGECCSFGERCKIENEKEFNGFLKFEGFGSEKRCTYFFHLTDNTIFVRCGCFSGTLDEFKEKVKQTHGDSKHSKEYLAIANLAQAHFEE